MSIETAVILVAGVGSRLRPITDDRPKALVDIAGETILGRACRLLWAAGTRRFVLATGYREDSVRQAVQTLDGEFVFCRNDDYASTQNSVSLALCAHALEGRAFLKLDGDVVFEPAVIERLLAAADAADELRVLVDSRRARDAEAMKIRSDGACILEFGKGLGIDDSQAETIGIEWLSAKAGQRVLDAITAHVERGQRGLYYEDVYSELLQAGALSASAIEVGDLAWTEVDTFEDLERARGLLTPLRNS
jgi:choline kinase